MKLDNRTIGYFSTAAHMPALYWLAATALEGLCACISFAHIPANGRHWWMAAAISHLAAAAILLSMSAAMRREMPSKDRYRLRLYGMLVLFLPLMGLAGSLVLHLACDRWIRARGLVEDFQAETEQRVIEPQHLEERMDLEAFFDQELAVQPVMDILAGYDDDLKRGAIDTLRRIGTPEAVKILKKCLTDASPEVRYNAHTALTRLDESHILRIRKSQQQLSSVNRQADAYVGYAEHCSAYGQSGLLDADTRRHYLQLAREALVNARETAPAARELMLDLARLEMALGAYADAAIHFRTILAGEPHNARALVGLAEVCFTSGDAEGLQSATRQMAAAAGVDTGSVNEGIVFNFWAESQRSL